MKSIFRFPLPLVCLVMASGVRADTAAAEPTAPAIGRLGLGIKEDAGAIVVEKLTPNLPAARSRAIKLGDRLVSISADGQAATPCQGMKQDQAMVRLRGAVGEPVTLRIASPSERDDQARELTLTREAVPETAFRAGDPAPELRTGTWIKGEPVKKFEPGTVYLLDFWATWCGSCVAGMPAIEAIHQKYHNRGLVVIGQDIWETDEDLVRKFVAAKGDTITYRLVMDDISAEGAKKTPEHPMPRGAMSETWIQPESGLAYGIPTLFLVGKDGRMVWSGSPEHLTDAIIESALDAPWSASKG